MLVNIPLTDDEQAAVEDGEAALDQLLLRLADRSVPGWNNTTPIDRQPVANRRCQPWPTRTHLTFLIPQND